MVLRQVQFLLPLGQWRRRTLAIRFSGQALGPHAATAEASAPVSRGVCTESLTPPQHQHPCRPSSALVSTYIRGGGQVRAVSQGARDSRTSPLTLTETGRQQSGGHGIRTPHESFDKTATYTGGGAESGAQTAGQTPGCPDPSLAGVWHLLPPAAQQTLLEAYGRD